MSWSFTRWLDCVGDHISKAKEDKTGFVLLTFFSDEEEHKMLQLWKQGVKPKQAAKRYLDGEL